MSCSIALGLLVAAAGCATYEGKPIDAARTAEDFEARRLQSAELEHWLHDEAHVESAEQRSTWTLNDLSFVAFHWHPDLVVARAHVASAMSGITTAAQRPNPTLAFDTEYASRAGIGVKPWILGFKLDFPIETGDKRELRTDVAQISARIAENEAYATAWSVRSRVRRTLVDVVLADLALDLARVERDLRDERVKILQQRFEAGEVSQPDLTSASIEAVQAQIASRTADAQTNEARSALADALGAPIEALTGATFAWPNLDDLPQAPPAQEARREALRDRLDVARALLEYELAEKSLQLEIAKQYPDVQLGPGFAWDQGQGKYSIGFSFPIPLMNHNEGPIAEALSKRREVEARFLAAQAHAISEIDGAIRDFSQRRAALVEVSTLANTLRNQQNAARARLDAGDTDRFSVIEVSVQVAAIERQRFEALREAQRSLATLEQVLQRSLAKDDRDLDTARSQAMKP